MQVLLIPPRPEMTVGIMALAASARRGSRPAEEHTQSPDYSFCGL